MRQLARTLLILGGVTACERAEPLVDDRRPKVAQPVVDQHDAPAVGNIGQAGRPTTTAHAEFRAGASVPLADAHGSPAVGNIGQAGDPHPQPSRRRERAQRAASRSAIPPVVSRPAIPPSVPPSRRSASSLSIEATPQPQVSLSARPLVDARERPAVGNIPQYEGKIVRKCGSPEDCGERPLTPGERARLAFQANQSVSRPLFDSREQPMVGNVSREGRRGPRTPREKLPDLAYRIRNLEDNMNAAQTADLRDQYRTALAQAIDDYIVLERKVKAGRGDEE